MFWFSTTMLPITAYIITFNEEFYIGSCIECLNQFVSQVFVLDSYSTDSTVDIASSKGAIVYQKHFTNFGDHWNSFLPASI